MDTNNYIQEAERQLGDTNFYVETESDMTEQQFLKRGNIQKKKFDKLDIAIETLCQPITRKVKKIEQQNSIFTPKNTRKMFKVDPLSVVIDVQHRKNLSFPG